MSHNERIETLKVLHLGHYAVDKMQLRALETVYWSGINKDILKQYQSCKTCIKHSKSQRCEPLQSHPTPELPWHMVATDLFEIWNSKYLLLVDYYSRFPVLCKLGSTTSRVLVQEMKAVFAELGSPKCDSLKTVDHSTPQQSLKTLQSNGKLSIESHHQGIPSQMVWQRDVYRL